MIEQEKTMTAQVSIRDWIMQLTCAGIAVTAAIAAFGGAFYAFIVIMAVGERGALPFVALAGVATFCGIPVMAKWLNQHLLTAFSKRLKR